MRKILKFVLLFVLVFGLGIFNTSKAIEDGLLFHLDFENGMIPTSGNVEATLHGGAEITENGRSNNYLHLDKSSGSYLQIGAEILNGQENLSLMFWVRMNENPLNYSRVFDMGYVEGGVKSFISMQYINSTLNLGISKNFPQQDRIDSNSSIALGGWSYLAFIYDQEGNVKVYLNGEEVISNTLGYGPKDHKFNDCSFGKSLFSGDPYINMDIDDLKIFNRVLTKEEIELQSGITVNDAINKDLESLVIPSTIDSIQIDLKKSGDNGTKISWEINNSIISSDGMINRDGMESAVDVEIKAIVSKGELSQSKIFNVKVLPISSNLKYQSTVANNVSLLEGRFYDSKLINKDYMFYLDTDKLLANFRITAGLAPKDTEYGGWLARDVGAGNFEGHFISALAFLYAEEKSSETLEKLNYIIDEIKLCQDEYAKLNPNEAGYIAAITPDTLTQLENTGNCNWVPYYNLEKLISGLYDAYYYANIEKAYDMMIDLCDWVSRRVNNYSDFNLNNVLNKEYGGIGYILFKVYLLSNDKNHLNAGLKFCEKSLFDAVYQGEDPFSYKHSNTIIPKLMTSLYAYLATGDEYYLTVAIKGFDLIYDGRTFATGGTSQVEEFKPRHELDNTGFMSQETCCSYNMLRLSDLLYLITGDKLYMDYYEKTLFNSILTSIDPETGMKTYNVSMDSGYYKIYHTKDDSFWCCTGTGVESFSKVNQTLYYQSQDGIITNQFVSSSYNDGKNTFTQTTNYPYEMKTTINVISLESKLYIRNPHWSENTKVYVNGVEKKDALVDGYFVFENVDGATIEVEFDAKFSLERLDNIHTEKYAIFYGPVLLSGVIENIGNVTPFQNNSMAGRINDEYNDELFYYNNIFEDIESLGNLEFILTANNQEVYLKPLFDISRETYIVYWNIFEENSPEFNNFVNEENINETYTIDIIDCGNWFSESVHNLQTSLSSIGNIATEHCRGVEQGGWVSYTMKVSQGVQNYLYMQHYGLDSGYTYGIYIDGKLIETRSINSQGAKFYELVSEIPLSSTLNKDSIEVKITSINGRLVPGLFGIRTVRAGLDEVNSFTLDYSNQGSHIVKLNGDTLYDKVSIESDKNAIVEVSYSPDGFKYYPMYRGEVNGLTEINYLCQMRKIKITSSDTSLKVKLYGDEVKSVASITEKVPTSESIIKQVEFIDVVLENSGLVKLKLDYSSIDLIGDINDYVDVYHTRLKAKIDVEVKELNQGLIKYINFDDNSQNYQVVGNATISNGKYGNSLNLNGNSYLDLGKLQLEDELTISMWVNFNSSNNVIWQHLFDFGDDKDNCLFMCPSGYATFNRNNIKSVITEKVYSYEANKWHLFTIVINNDNASTYLDGLKISSTSQFGYRSNIINEFNNFYIGKSNMDYVPILNAKIDEVRIYNYSLSDNQIEYLANLEKIK